MPIPRYNSHHYLPLHIYTQRPFPAEDSHSKTRREQGQHICAMDSLAHGDAYAYTGEPQLMSLPPLQVQVASVLHQLWGVVLTVTELMCCRQILWPAADYLHFRGSLNFSMTLQRPRCASCDVAACVEMCFCHVVACCASGSFAFRPSQERHLFHCHLQQQGVIQLTFGTCVY